MPFNELGSLAEAAAHRVGSFDDMHAAVLDYKAGKAWERCAERSALRQAMVPRDRSSVVIIMDDIAEGLGVGGLADARARA